MIWTDFGLLASLFFLGTVWGSFLGVLADRIPRNESILFPPSHCNHCNSRLSLLDLLPLYAWIIGKGRCRVCQSPIDRQTLYAELLTATLFILLGIIHLNGGNVLKPFVFGSFAIPLSLIDLRLYRLPHKLTITAMISGILLSFLDPGSSFKTSIEASVSALAFLVPIAYLKPNALGMGDAIFFGAIGSFTSIQGILVALIVASGTAILSSLAWSLWEVSNGRKASIKTLRIPFGPFLSLGGLTAILLPFPQFLI
ncbi:MAG: prepilin peptidase [Leptospirillum sp.]